jgi:hypothetical protein
MDEWIDITTLEDWARGIRREVNLAGRERTDDVFVQRRRFAFHGASGYPEGKVAGDDLPPDSPLSHIP